MLCKQPAVQGSPGKQQMGLKEAGAAAGRNQTSTRAGTGRGQDEEKMVGPRIWVLTSPVSRGKGWRAGKRVGRS